MSIIEEISTEMYRWMNEHHGVEPDFIYLGTKQCDEIKEVTQLFMVPYKPGETVPQRNHFNGIPIFRVDAEHFLNFGHGTPSPCG